MVVTKAHRVVRDKWIAIMCYFITVWQRIVITVSTQRVGAASHLVNVIQPIVICIE